MPDVWRAEWLDGPAKGMKATMLNQPKQRMGVRSKHYLGRMRPKVGVATAWYEGELDPKTRTCLYRYVGGDSQTSA